MPAGVRSVAVDANEIATALASALISTTRLPCLDYGEPGVAQRMLSALRVALGGGLAKLPFVDH